MNKKIYSREEFESFRVNEAEKMASDTDLNQRALNMVIEAGEKNWIHQTNWFGEPLLNLPQDMFAIQEIIFKTRPKYIIETGVAWGGSLLFYATLMNFLGGEKIIGVDIYIPDDLVERLKAFPGLYQKMLLINDSSISSQTIETLKKELNGSRDVLVLLDSDHSHDHVLKELNLYSPLIGQGHYLICCDTIVEHFEGQHHRNRPWGKGNNPMTALEEFLKHNSRFKRDDTIHNKLLMTCNPKGYLKCVKN